MAVVGGISVGVGFSELIGHYRYNILCCALHPARNVFVSIKELCGFGRYYGQTGQDKWVLETVFPGVSNGYFIDVGSADGTLFSNSKALEERGWTGICVDPFPRSMEDRTCQVFRETVYSVSGHKVVFHISGDLGGIADRLGTWKDVASKSATVELVTVTLADILERARAPAHIHFLSLDIEGAELDALRGFPFGRYKLGALAIEHNFEEPKRTMVQQLLSEHGYVRVHSWQQDDLYVARAGLERFRNVAAAEPPSLR